MAKQNNTKVVTGIVRLSYANVWEPKSINGGDPKYSCSIIIPKTDTETVNAINAAIDCAIKEGLDRSEVYSGVYAHVSLSFYAFNTNGNRGVACGLGNIQKVRDGEPLGGRTNAASEFETLDDEDFLS